MNSSDNGLFSPFKIGGLTLSGRFIKTATSETRAAENGESTDKLIEFYSPIAKANTPLIITGNIYVSKLGKSTPQQMGIEDDSKVSNLKKLVHAVHQNDCKIFAQLSHCGRQVVPDSVSAVDVVSASDVKDFLTGTKPRPLSEEEIEQVIDDFREAARRCVEAGFDGIQLHAGHGYLISQFLTPYTNRRSDIYGGSKTNRLRLLKEIYHVTRNQVGHQFPIILKLNGDDYLPLRHGLSTNDLVEIALEMEKTGVDAVEVSVGHYESGFPVVRGSFMRGMRAMVNGSIRYLPVVRRTLFRIFWPLIALICNVLWRYSPGFNLRYAKKFTSRLSIPVICVGGFLHKSDMQGALSKGYCDAISVGRALIANPYLYAHLKDNKSGPQCTYCNACVGHIGTQPLDCYHPQVRKEKDRMLNQ